MVSPGFFVAISISLVKLASVQRTLVEGQQVVVPLPIRIGADIRRFPRLADHADIGALTVSRVQHVKRVGFGVDARYHLSRVHIHFPDNIQHGVRVEETSNLQNWFGGKRSIEISEDVVGLGKYNKTLTVLYDIDIPEADEEEDEQSPIESWTPRFKR